MSASPDVPPRPRRNRRALLWAALVALLVVAQSLLVALTLSYESGRAQDRAEVVAAEVAADVRREAMRTTQALQALLWGTPPLADWPAGALELMRSRRELLRVERRDDALRIVDAVDSPYGAPLFQRLRRDEIDVESEVACSTAQRLAAPSFSRTYFVPAPDGRGVEVTDLCVPAGGSGYLVATFGLAALLDATVSTEQARSHEIAFVEADGTRLARVGSSRGAGVFSADRLVDLPGLALQLRTNAVAGRPSLIPNLATALVLGLSVALFGVVILLARDVRRRARAESALAEALAFRKAMEDSLSTGLRARDLQGRITYVNPAFCAMVGFGADELRAAEGLPPYWPPEHAAAYAERQRQRLGGGGFESREGFETVFMRKSGERFPVMIYEAPLVDGEGRHAGWMSAVVDVSAQRRIEELSRQQQDRLQATARLATVGEMASLLSHELNQPLAAIASYASGSLNLLEQEAPAGDEAAMLRQAVARIAEQAERAGRIIKSVHHFVRRREQQHETVGADALVDAVLPLVRLQARKSGTRIEIDLPPRPPRVHVDRTMVEQVLLNLTRNAIQAMDAVPQPERVLTVRVRQPHPRWVAFDVVDAGPGIAPEVAARLFTPFFTTKPEGMGLGLSLCRTVIEQHGGALDVGPGPGGRGAAFRFTLPAPKPLASAQSEAASAPPA